MNKRGRVIILILPLLISIIPTSVEYESQSGSTHIKVERRNLTKPDNRDLD